MCFYMSDEKKQKKDFKVDKGNVNNVVFIKRDKDLNRLVGEKVDEKKILFRDEERNIIKDPYQAWYVEKNGDVNNISASVNVHVNGSEEERNNVGNSIDYAPIKRVVVPVNNVGYRSEEYDRILSTLNNNFPVKETCKTVPEHTDPLVNYYYTVFGQRLKSNLSDYMSAYKTIMENDGKFEKCIPVETMEGQNDFVLQPMYNYESNLTNGYNVAWEFIENPLAIY